MRWTKAMNESGGVDIAAQIRKSLANANEDHSND